MVCCLKTFKINKQLEPLVQNARPWKANNLEVTYCKSHVTTYGKELRTCISTCETFDIFQVKSVGSF